MIKGVTVALMLTMLLGLVLAHRPRSLAYDLLITNALAKTSRTNLVSNGNIVPRDLATRFAETIDALDYGVVCDNATATDVQINASVSAAALIGGTVQLPPGICKIANSIAWTASNVSIAGRGIQSTIIAPEGNIVAIRVGTTSPTNDIRYVTSTIIRDLGISWSSKIGVGAECIDLVHSGTAIVERVYCNNPYIGYEILSGTTIALRDCILAGFAVNDPQYGIYLHGDEGTSPAISHHPIKVIVSNLQSTLPAATGGFPDFIYITACEECAINDSYLGGGVKSDVLIQLVSADGAQSIQDVTFHDDYLDGLTPGSSGCAFQIQGRPGDAVIQGTVLSDSYVSGGGNLGTSHGICNSGGNNTNTRLINNLVYAWPSTGIDLENGSNIQIIGGAVVGNNYANSNMGSAGIHIGANIDHFIALGVRVGGDQYGNNSASAFQTYGFLFDSGAQDISVAGGDITGNETALRDNTPTNGTVKKIFSGINGLGGGFVDYTSSMPASNTEFLNPFGRLATVVLAGICSEIAVNRRRQFSGTCNPGNGIEVGPQDTLTVTYSGSLSSSYWWLH